MTYDILIRGGTILTGEPGAEPIRDGVVGIAGNTISRISGVVDEPVEAHRTIDARGHLVMPGFVNVHTHAVLAMARGMTEDMGFAPAYTQGVPHVLDPTEEEAAALAQLTGLELMLAGSTTVNDMYAHAHATLPAMAELGLRISSSAWIHDVDFSRVHEGVFEYDPAIGARTLRYGIDLADRF